MNSLSVKTNSKGQFKSLKLIFPKFVGQFDLKVKVKVKVFRIVQDFRFEGSRSSVFKHCPRPSCGQYLVQV